MRRTLLTATALAAFMLTLPIGQATAQEGVADLKDPSIRSFAMACSPARAQLRGEQLSEQRALVLAFCYGFVAGSSESPSNAKMDCAPAGVTVQQRVLILLKWAEENPEALNLDRGVALALAVAAAFPCGRPS